MRNRFIVGATVMVVTIISMGWIYIDQKEKSMRIISESSNPFADETICTDRAWLKRQNDKQ